MIDVLVDNTLDPVRNLALDEALARSASSTPVIRIWQSSPCLMVGRFHRLTRAVDLVACARDGLPVVRRAGGGEPYYSGPGSLHVSLTTPRGRTGFPSLAPMLADAVAWLGAVITSDLLIDGHRFASTSAIRTRGAVLEHATVQVTTPSWLLGRYLSPLVDRDPLTSVARPGLSVDADVIRESLMTVVHAHYGGAYPRHPDDAEHNWQERLIRVKYGDPLWHVTGRGWRRRTGAPRHSRS
ncbi:lipoate--protein ligase family protein [Rhizohabitans arisaemae]|uniref:lipoate--protein ligase family protein n=1 Tax=Rhizohabitans arisaemae TaxID=2720610 RepID=UPI0024B07C9A|nr:hypothetical protein [Rhizohabitans arisaemae]